MRKTLQDLAQEYHARKPALYARLKKLEKAYQDKELSSKVGNVLYLTEEGLRLLEADLNENPVNTKIKGAKPKRAKRQIVAQEADSGKELIDTLKSEIDLLKSQLEEKDRTIESLLSIVESLNSNYSQSLAESHTLTSQQQTIQALELSQAENSIQDTAKPKRKTSFLSKLVFTGKLFKGDFD